MCVCIDIYLSPSPSPFLVGVVRANRGVPYTYLRTREINKPCPGKRGFRRARRCQTPPARGRGRVKRRGSAPFARYPAIRQCKQYRCPPIGNLNLDIVPSTRRYFYRRVSLAFIFVRRDGGHWRCVSGASAPGKYYCTFAFYTHRTFN